MGTHHNDLFRKYRERHWSAASQDQRDELLTIDHREAVIEHNKRFPEQRIRWSGPMHIDYQGVCVWLNLGITEYICGIRNAQDATTRITLCLNGITEVDARDIVLTNGLFTVDETTGMIQGHKGIRVPEAGTL